MNSHPKIHANLPLSEHSRHIPSHFPSVMLDQIVYCMQNKIADLQVRCIISFDGRVEAERMAQAVRLSLDAEPILGCRFVERWWRPYWKRREDLNHLKNFTLVKTTDSASEIIRFLSESINPLETPLVQVQIVRSETDTLCITMNHMVTDAAGLKEYIYLLASIYRKLANNLYYTPQCTMGYERGLHQISRGFGFIDKLRIVCSGYRDFKRKFFPPGSWSFPATVGTFSHNTFVTRQFGPNRFRTLKNYGHKHHATLNEIMLAALFRSLVDHITPAPGLPLRLAFTVDLRRYLSPGEQSGAIRNLSNFAVMNIRPEIGETFEGTLAKVRDEMITMKSDFLGLADYPFGSLFAKTLPFAWYQKLFAQSLRLLIKSKNTPPVLSNAGIIDSQKLVFSNDVTVNNAHLLAANLFPPALAIGLSSYRGSLTLSISFFESAIKKSAVERLLDLMDSHLPR